jgi:hypothetical protein
MPLSVHRGIWSETRNSEVLLERILHANDDPVARLYAHYFLQADVLFGYLRKLDGEKVRKGRLSKNKELDAFQLRKLWLAALYVLAEGFKTPLIQKSLAPWKEMSLNVRVYCNSIEHKMGQLGDELRLFRNATFHYQPTPQKHLQFIHVQGRHKPMFWAGELHHEFEKLFNEYRALHFVEYAVQQRGKEGSKSPCS